MIVMRFLKRIVRPEKVIKAIMVPRRPKSTMFVKFWKNFFLCILNPEAKMIGGSTK